MFKTTDKISKAIELLRKAAEEINNEERKNQTITAIHDLTILQSDCFADIKREPLGSDS